MHTELGKYHILKYIMDVTSASITLPHSKSSSSKSLKIFMRGNIKKRRDANANVNNNISPMDSASSFKELSESEIQMQIADSINNNPQRLRVRRLENIEDSLYDDEVSEEEPAQLLADTVSETEEDCGGYSDDSPTLMEETTAEAAAHEQFPSSRPFKLKVCRKASTMDFKTLRPPAPLLAPSPVPTNEFICIRDKQESSSSVTDSNLDLPLEDTGESNMEPESGDDELLKDCFQEFKECIQSEQQGSILLGKQGSSSRSSKDEDENESPEVESDISLGSPRQALSEMSKHFNNNGSNTQSGLTSPCPYPPPMPINWYSAFYHGCPRPSWDSSVYNPNCNRPAWDEHIYEEARKKLQRHEAVKSKMNMFEFQLFPVAITNYHLKSPSNRTISANNSQKVLQLPELKRGNNGSNGNINKLSSTQFRRQLPEPGEEETAGDSNKGMPDIKEPLQLLSPDALLESKSSPQSLISSHEKAAVKYGTIIKNSTAFDKLECGTITEAALNTNPSQISRGVECRGRRRLRDFTTSSSLRRIVAEERRRKIRAMVAEARDTSKPKPSRSRPMNPLPRVALLSRPNHNNNYNNEARDFDAFWRPGVQVWDERGRIKPQWDPSPFVPVGKKNAWSDSIHKCDYFRIKRDR